MKLNRILVKGFDLVAEGFPYNSSAMPAWRNDMAVSLALLPEYHHPIADQPLFNSAIIGFNSCNNLAWVSAGTTPPASCASGRGHMPVRI